MKILAWISCMLALGSMFMYATTAFSCQPLDSKLFNECLQVGYNVSDFMDNSTQSEILQLITNMQGKFKQCSSLSDLMTCSVHVPRCSSGSGGANLPCMEVCERFVTECNSSLTEYGLMALFTSLCQLLPRTDSGKCLKPGKFHSSQHNSKSFDSTCESLTVHQCLDIGYNVTYASAARQKLVEKSAVFQGINTTACPRLRKLVCVEVVPPCDPKNNQSLYVPCKSLCDNAFHECPKQFAEIFKNHSYCSTFALDKTQGAQEYCVLETWPTHGFWPSNLWTSLGATGANENSFVNGTSTPAVSTQTISTPSTPGQNMSSSTKLPSSSLKPNTTSASSTPIQNMSSSPKPTTNYTTTVPSTPSQNMSSSTKPPSSSPKPTTNQTTSVPSTSSQNMSSSPKPNITTVPSTPSQNMSSSTKPPSTSPKPLTNHTTTAPSKPSQNMSSSLKPNTTSAPTTPSQNMSSSTKPPSSSAKPTTNQTTSVPSTPGQNMSSSPKPNTTSAPTTAKQNMSSSTKPPSSSPRPSTNHTTSPPSTPGQNMSSSTKPPSSSAKPPTNQTTSVPSTPGQNMSSSTKPPSSSPRPPTNHTTSPPSTPGQSKKSSSKPHTASGTSTPARNKPQTSKGSPDVQSSKSVGMSAGAISGVVLGVLALVVAIAVGVVCFRKYDKNKRQFRHSLMVDMDEL